MHSVQHTPSQEQLTAAQLRRHGCKGQQQPIRRWPQAIRKLPAQAVVSGLTLFLHDGVLMLRRAAEMADTKILSTVGVAMQTFGGIADGVARINTGPHLSMARHRPRLLQSNIHNTIILNDGGLLEPTSCGCW